MFAHRSDEVNLKKAYVGVTNVLESNPNAKSEPAVTSISVRNRGSTTTSGWGEAWLQKPTDSTTKRLACASLFARSAISMHRQAQGQVLRVGIKVVLRLQIAIRVFGQIVLKQR